MEVDAWDTVADMDDGHASGKMMLTHGEDDYIIVQYTCQLLTYTEEAEYMDGMMVWPRWCLCEGTKNLNYRIIESGADATEYNHIDRIIDEYVVRYANNDLDNFSLEDVA